MKDFAQNSCRVALIQAGPVMFDKAATVERALALKRPPGRAPSSLCSPNPSSHAIPTA